MTKSLPDLCSADWSTKSFGVYGPRVVSQYLNLRDLYYKPYHSPPTTTYRSQFLEQLFEFREFLDFKILQLTNSKLMKWKRYTKK